MFFGLCGVTYIQGTHGEILSCNNIAKYTCIYIYIICVNTVLDIGQVEVLRKVKW